MIGIDTNVLVRQLTQDDPVQSRIASALFDKIDEHNPAYISLVVSLEVSWVLKRAYGLSNTLIADCFSQLLSTRGLQIQFSEVLAQAVAQIYQNPTLGLADCVIHLLNQQAGCSVTYTFDQHAARYAGMKLLSP